MATENEEALRLFAEVFENLRIGALGCAFWDDMRPDEFGLKPEGDEDEIPTDQCSIM
jgi:hypothetical protein